ncbi:uncharacterized protein METZ01_LOCUS182125 [marine metagenome]|uniref:Uncharacterized protein n=1 Tax=marine metagenome TaxID=408172 RepID=A0A382CUQ9_9ZZZZ
MLVERIISLAANMHRAEKQKIMAA